MNLSKVILISIIVSCIVYIIWLLYCWLLKQWNDENQTVLEIYSDDNGQYQLNQMDQQIVDDVLDRDPIIVQFYARQFINGEINKNYIKYMKQVINNYIDMTKQHKSNKKHAKHFFRQLKKLIKKLSIRKCTIPQSKVEQYWKAILVQGEDALDEDRPRPRTTAMLQIDPPNMYLNQYAQTALPQANQPQPFIQGNHQTLQTNQLQPQQIQQQTTTKPLSKTPSTLIREAIAEKTKSDSQNVHDSTVVQSAKHILYKTADDKMANNNASNSNEITNSTITSDQSVINYIQSINYDDVNKKDKAIVAARHILQNGRTVIPYDKTEQDILQQTVQQLQKNKKQDNDNYFVESLAECVGKNNSIVICPGGRATRLIDVIGFASEQRIIPGHVIKEQILNKMNQLYQSTENKDEMKTQLGEYINTEFKSKGLVTEAKQKEYVQMIDAL